MPQAQLVTRKVPTSAADGTATTQASVSTAETNETVIRSTDSPTSKGRAAS
jgi:hypothetical protein